MSFFTLIRNCRKILIDALFPLFHDLPSFSGTIQYSELMKLSSESEVAEIEKLQSSIAPDEGCNIQFTSGTTGQPKAALISHFSLVNSGNDTGVRIELDKYYRKICCNMPFFHVAGVISMMSSIGHASTLFIPAPHFNAEASLRTIATERCDAVYGTPNSNQNKTEMRCKQFKEFNFSVRRHDREAEGAEARPSRTGILNRWSGDLHAEAGKGCQKILEDQAFQIKLWHDGDGSFWIPIVTG